MHFSEIIGQHKMKQQLVQQVRENRVPHAMLFSSPEGSGALPLAIAFAEYLLCENPSETDSCGVCPSCIKLRKLAHPDLHFSFPVIKKGTSATSDNYMKEWRDLMAQTYYFGFDAWLEQLKAENKQPLIYGEESANILHKLSLKSSEGGYKILIMWLPEKMHNTCANKLLKMIEEPPEKTVLLLVSERPEEVLGTIQSRTQRMEIPLLSTNDICQSLQQNNGLSPEDALLIARLSAGNYVKVLHSIHVNKDSQLFLDMFIQLMRLSYQRNIKEMQVWSEQVASWGRERQKNFLTYCQRLVRENFMYNFHLPDLNYMTTAESEFSLRFARFINERNVIGISAELAAAQRDIIQNVNPKMVFFDFSLKMIVLLIQ
ncbi:MAG: DNA polymerase III subunit delta [Bacteroidaceae bacterium]